MQLIVKELSKRYDPSHEAALKKVSLTIAKGEFISILGPSGSGKSTFIRCINGLLSPSEGQILYEDEEVTKYTKTQLKAYRRKIGMIFQNYNLIHSLDVQTNVMVGRFGYKTFGEILFKRFTPEEKETVDHALHLVGLQAYAKKRATKLSGGQQQRVGIARALVQNPEIILGDEPVSSLDPITALRIMELLQQINKEKKITMIINLHSIDLAKAFSTRIIGINNGFVVFDGPPASLTEEKITKIYNTEE